MIRFCRDCRYINLSRPNSYDIAKCNHPLAEKPRTEYLVSGKKDAEPMYQYASSMRIGILCGEHGELWEKKR